VTLRPGSGLGTYSILGPLPAPAAGQGELWRAHDSLRDREVRIRTFPPAISGDRERLALIQAAAQALSTLDDPRVARVYGLEESGGMPFLVAELVGGETLAERVKRGAIPVAESLALALQMAQALQAAHDLGILHRNLDPSTIRLAPDGGIKILDFGLPALLGAGDAPRASGPHVAQSSARSAPTMLAASGASAVSMASVYLAPELARGVPPDVRADVWAFGCVLFTMLAGRPPFHGKTEQDLRADVLRSDPDWERLPAELPARVRFLLERCLEKDPARRPSDMAGIRVDVAKAIEDPHDTFAGRGLRPASIARWVAAVVATIALGFAASWALRSDAGAPIVRYEMWASRPSGAASLLQGASPELAISPDGSRIAFKGVDGRLYLRDRDDLTSRPLQITGGTRTLYAPLFSRDGRELYYVDAPPAEPLPAAIAAVLPREMVFSSIADSGLDLKRVGIDGGTPTPVLTKRYEEVLDATWSSDDALLFVDMKGSIQSVAADGGTPATLLDAPGARHPQLLPGGGWLLYSIGDIIVPIVRGTAAGPAQIIVQSLADPNDRRVLFDGGTAARYVETTGHIVYLGVSQPGLWAFPFDAARLEKTGDAVPLVEGTIVDYALAETGALAYAAILGVPPPTVAAQAGGNVVALVNRSGVISRRLRVDPGLYRNPRVSPDGSRVAYELVDESGASHVWVYDLVEDFPRKLTFAGENRNPIWKNDQSVTYASRQDSSWAVYTQNADDGGDSLLVTSAPEGFVYRPQDWAPDGTLVLVVAAEEAAERTGRLALLPPNGNGEVREIAPAERGAAEFGARLSPDGTWLAYIAQCDGTRLGCARVQRFPPVPGSSILVSANEAWVQFSPDGKQLLTNRFNVFDAWELVPRGASVDFRNPRRTPLAGFQAATDYRSLDLRGPGTGSEFVMIVPVNASGTIAAQQAAASASSRIGFVHNFHAVLEQRVRASTDR
jgi:Tol biopolymer transport system component